MFNQKEYSKIKNILKISKKKNVSPYGNFLLKSSANKHSFILQLVKKINFIEDQRIKFVRHNKLIGRCCADRTFQEEHFKPHINNIEEWFFNTTSLSRRS